MYKNLVFVVGCWRDEKSWEVAGVFSTEANAIAACRTDQYFVGPIELDKVAPEEPTDWPGLYFPLAED